MLSKSVGLVAVVALGLLFAVSQAQALRVQAYNLQCIDAPNSTTTATLVVDVVTSSQKHYFINATCNSDQNGGVSQYTWPQMADADGPVLAFEGMVVITLTHPGSPGQTRVHTFGGTGGGIEERRWVDIRAGEGEVTFLLSMP